MKRLRLSHAEATSPAIMEQSLERLGVYEEDDVILIKADDFDSGEGKALQEQIASRARARTTDPETSHAAAAAASDKLRTSQLDVLKVLAEHKFGITDEELVEQYDRATSAEMVSTQSPSGIRTRRAELCAAGKVMDTGERRQTESGNKAIVWAAIPDEQYQDALIDDD